MFKLPDLYRLITIDRPWLSLVFLALLMAGATLGVPEFRLDASSDSLVEQNDASLSFFRQASSRYGGTEFLILTYAPEQDLLSAPVLAQIKKLKMQLTDIPGVKSVFSLLDAPLLRSPPVPLSELSDNIRTLQSADVDKQLAREELTSSPLYRQLLVSADGRSTALQISLETDQQSVDLLNRRYQLLDSLKTRADDATLSAELAQVSAELSRHRATAATQRHELILSIRDLVVPFREQAEIHLAGVPMIADDMLNFIRSDISNFGAGVLLLMITALALFFRQLRWVILPLAAGGITVFLMTGILGLANWTVTVISSNFISLLLIISISLSIHLIVRFQEMQRQDPGQALHQLTEQVARDKFWPCLYTALTTMVAFASLTASDIVPVSDFGAMMTIGVGLALLVNFMLIPAVTMLLPAPAVPAGPLSGRVALADGLARITLRGPWQTLLIAGLCALLAGAGMTRLSVDTRFIDYFDDSTEIYQGMSFIDAHLGGTTPLEVLVDFPATSAFITDEFVDDFADDFAEDEDQDTDLYWFTPDKIAFIEQLHDYLQAQPETGKVISLATLHAIARQFNDGRSLNALELAAVIRLIPEEFRQTLLLPYASPGNNQARIAVRMIESNASLRREQFLARIHTHMSELAGNEQRIQLTGLMVLFNNVLQTLVTSQVSTVFWVVAGILLAFIALFRSLPLGALALLPNMLAAALVLGIMGWARIPLDIMTTTIAAVVIGIGVDHTIHYVHRFRRELALGREYPDAIRASHGSIGHAIYYTSLTVIVGFSVLTLSNFSPTIYFGALTALSMALALLANLTLLPALLLLSRPLPGTGQLASE